MYSDQAARFIEALNWYARVGQREGIQWLIEQQAVLDVLPANAYVAPF